MKWIKFSKYTGEDFGIDANDLMQALADFFLQSGFNNPYMQFQEWNQQTLEDLKRAIQEALESGKLFPDDQMQQMLEKLCLRCRRNSWTSCWKIWSRKARGRGPYFDRAGCRKHPGSGAGKGRGQA